ncbi:MAG TPA: hypothetical protein VGD97_09440 [Lacunisphaera sp.]
MMFKSRAIMLLCAVVTLTGCGRQNEARVAATPENTKPVPKPLASDFQSPWQTESEYIVTMVAADLVEMAYHAKHGRALEMNLPVEVREMTSSTEARPVYQVRAALGQEGEVTCELGIDTPIWAPRTYAPLVRMLFEKLQLSGTEGGTEPVLLKQLQDLRVETLAKADVELSEQLAREFAVPERHEEAAFLLGAFTLRQTNGLFFQLRAELCRMTAHLAFAGGLRANKTPPVTGQLAAALLTVLYNNQADALELLAPVPDEGEAGVWKRTLRMRATGDFRIIGESRTRALCEELEWFRARAESVSEDRAWASLRLSGEQQVLADWTRVLGAERSTVPMGHIVLRAGLPAELREVALAYEAVEGKALPPGELVEALNAEPRRCVTAAAGGNARIGVIGWGMWAAFLQRQLCQALTTNFLFMRDGWGVPDEARQYQEAIDREFWGLRLYPFVRRQCAPDHAYYKKAQDEEMALVRRSPHVVPAGAWNYISFENPLGPIYWPPPHPFINEWHRPNPVPGTAYNPWPRMSHRSLTERPDVVARLERMHQLAPYDGIVSHNLLRIRDGEKQTAELVEKTYAAGLDFQTVPLRKLARLTRDPAAKERWIRKSAAIDPSDYWQLAQFYIEQRQEDDAAQAYVEWIDNEIDEVAVSNSAEWLIRYFERKGDIASARNLADRAAAAYSSAGLLAKARLLERQRETDGALEFYQKQAERYDDHGPVIGFLIRLKEAGSSEHAALRDSLMKEHLPAGLMKFDKTTQTAPRIGVRVPEQGTGEWRPGSRIEAAGLRRGDIVVAVRGYRVADWESFKVLRRLEPEVPYILIIWRDKKYLELPPLASNYRFGVDLVDYRAP